MLHHYKPFPEYQLRSYVHLPRTTCAGDHGVRDPRPVQHGAPTKAAATSVCVPASIIVDDVLFGSIATIK
jgi:hypothetical protein